MRDKLDPGVDNRTFETRLEFIAGVFSHPHSKEDILASSIQFKLNKTYQQYIDELNESFALLVQKSVQNPENVIKKLK